MPDGFQSAPVKAGDRVIKKYPNRRLYDTESSAYITLAEVKQLVMRQQPLVVLDAKTNQDLTRSVLLQIILEEEAGGAPMFSEAALANLIRFYGHAMQGFMGVCLERSVQAFTDMHTRFAEQAASTKTDAWAPFLTVPPPLLQSGLTRYLEQSQAVLQQMHEQLHKQADHMLDAFGMKR